MFAGAGGGNIRTHGFRVDPEHSPATKKIWEALVDIKHSVRSCCTRNYQSMRRCKETILAALLDSSPYCGRSLQTNLDNSLRTEKQISRAQVKNKQNARANAGGKPICLFCGTKFPFAHRRWDKSSNSAAS